MIGDHSARRPGEAAHVRTGPTGSVATATIHGPAAHTAPATHDIANTSARAVAQAWPRPRPGWSPGSTWLPPKIEPLHVVIENVENKSAHVLEYAFWWWTEQRRPLSEGAEDDRSGGNRPSTGAAVADQS